MAWFDYEKADDMVPNLQISDYLKIHKISNKIINIISNAIRDCPVELITEGETLAEVRIQRVIFQ